MCQWGKSDTCDFLEMKTMNMRTFQRFLMMPALAGVALFCQTARAQEWKLPPAVLGFTAGYDLGSAIATTANDPGYYNNQFTNRATVESISMNLIFPKLFANGFGLSTNFSYGFYHLRAEGTDTRRLTDGAGSFFDAPVDVLYNLETKALEMDLLAYIQVGDIARIEVGPWAGFGFFPSYTMEETASVGWFDEGSGMLANVHFENGSDKLSFLANFGGEFKASLEIPFVGGTALVPSGRLRAALIVPSGTNELGVVGTAGIGLGLLFGRPNGELLPPPLAKPTSTIDTVLVPVPVAPPPAMHASVDLYSQDSAGRRTDTLMLSPRRTLHRIEVPLLSHIRFDRNSASLPTRYTGYTASNREDFSLDAFAGRDVITIQRQSLNVVGMRLAAERSARIIINGSSLPDEPKWFAGARAAAVRDYLTGTWGIPSSRITLKNSTAASDGASVTIASVSPAVTSPIITEWIDQEINAAPIGIEPQVASNHGIKEWRVAVSYNGKELGVARSSDQQGSTVIDAGVLVDNIPNAGPIPGLDAELIVEDSSGAVKVAHDQMAVVLADGSSQGDSASSTIERQIDTYLLPDAAGSDLDRTIQQIAGSISDGASITLAPGGLPGADQAAMAGRLKYIAEQLRSLCDAEGKHIAEIRISDRPPVQIATEQTAGEDLSPAIEVAVAQNYSR
jgi:hypothetical protein